MKPAAGLLFVSGCDNLSCVLFLTLASKVHAYRNLVATVLRFGLGALILVPRVHALASEPSAGLANRFLFVVDTSDTRQCRFAAAARAVENILDSGIGGQAREGDTVGVWTFHESFANSHFPLERWSVPFQATITAHVLFYLHEKKTDRHSALGPLIPALQRVVSNSPSITVILVSDGSEVISNTPFDDTMNAFYKKWRRKQRKEKCPFVTVLQAKGGQFIHCALTAPSAPLEMPPMSSEPKPGGISRTKVKPGIAPAAGGELPLSLDPPRPRSIDLGAAPNASVPVKGP